MRKPDEDLRESRDRRYLQPQPDRDGGDSDPSRVQIALRSARKKVSEARTRRKAKRLKAESNSQSLGERLLGEDTAADAKKLADTVSGSSSGSSVGSTLRKGASALASAGESIGGALPEESGGRRRRRAENTADRAARSAEASPVIPDATLSPTTAPEDIAMRFGGAGDMRVDDLATGARGAQMRGGGVFFGAPPGRESQPSGGGAGVAPTGFDPTGGGLVLGGGERRDQGRRDRDRDDGGGDPLDVYSPFI